MPSFEPLIQHLAPFAIVSARMGGAFLFAPMIAGLNVPFQYRAMVVFAFSLCVYPLVPIESIASTELTLLGLIPVLASELAIGAVLGLLISLPLTMMQLAGEIIGYQMGLGLAAVYNPDLDATSNPVSTLIYYLAAATFIAIGGLDAIFYGLVRTFESIPIGAFALDEPPMGLYIELLNNSMELGLRVGMPVVGTLFIVLIVLGFIMKTMPQINILSVGFSFKIMAGLIVLFLGVFRMDDAIAYDLGEAMRTIMNWITTFDPSVGRSPIVEPGIPLPSADSPSAMGQMAGGN